jgi:exopolysaccharide biosynthesis polyprenyl glycosylphosphotransferase
MARRSTLEKHHLRLTATSGNPASSAYGASALHVRTRLRERRPVSVKRHSARIATRLAVLFVGDMAAVVALHLVASWATTRLGLGSGVAGQFASVLGTGYGAGLNFGLALIISLVVTGNYSRHRTLNGSLRLLAASILASAVVLWGTVSFGQLATAVAAWAVAAALAWLILLGERAVTEEFLSRVWPGARGAAPAVLITDRREASLQLERAVIGAGGDYSLAGYVPLGRITFDGVLGSIRDLPEIIATHHVEAVVVCQHLNDQQIINVREASLAAGCQLLYPARAVKIAGVRPALVWHQDQPFFELGAPVLKASAVITKRIVDVVGAVAGIIVLAPVLALIAIAIKFDSPGPVFFAQDRAGLGGRRFRMLKFRTMRVGADAEKHALSHLNHSGDSRLFKIPEDPRVTRLGGLLRRWSLDELPQFWNVVRGDMSIVGPRPFFEADFASYQDHHFRRLDAKPGITGLWQVSGRSEVVDFEDVVYLDRQYIEQWSPWLDVSIMFRTLPAVVRRTGAY